MEKLWNMAKIVSKEEMDASVRWMVVLSTIITSMLALVGSVLITLMLHVGTSLMIQIVVTCVMFFGIVIGMFGSTLWLLRHI